MWCDMIRATTVLSLSVLLLLSACGGIGPLTVSRDRFDYTAVISDSWKRQMLLDIVMMRYGDAPVFMDVSSVISQYQVTGQISLGARVTPQSATRNETFGTSGQYIDRRRLRPSWEKNLPAVSRPLSLPPPSST